MKTNVKICGIRRKESAVAAVDAGADYLGFNFVPTSKRKIDPDVAKQIIKEISGKIKIVGIFQNQENTFINYLIDYVGLEFVQLHGQEDIKSFKQINAKIIKSISIAENTNVDQLFTQMEKYQIEAFLLDREVQGKGNIINSDIARRIAENFPVFLAGGLLPETVAVAVKTVHPYAVDVAGGIETDGREDQEKINAFIYNAKGRN